MDPQATLNTLLTSDDRDEIEGSAQALYDWIRRGGFRPRAENTRGEPLPENWAMGVGGIVFRRLGDGTIGVD